MPKSSAVSLLLVGLYCLLTCAGAQGLPASYPPLAGNAALERALLSYTNRARAEHGLPPLTFDDKLALAARHHAAEMVRLHYLSHDSPNPDTATLARRVAKAGLATQTLGENIAAVSYDQEIAQKVVEGWLASPGHRSNLLNQTYSHVGFGTATDERGVTYIVQDFAYRPLGLEDVALRPYTIRSYELELTLRLSAPQEVLLVYGQTSSRPIHLTAGRQTLSVNVSGPERLHLSIGVKSAGKGYILQDEGWLELPTERFSPSPSAPRRSLSIERVEVAPRESERYQVELEFEKPPRAALAVWLNGAPLKSTTLTGRSLQFDLPRGAAPQVIDLGLQAQGNRYQVVMSLALDTSLGATRLVPHAK